ncbi:CHAT domain-containing protein [Actinoplanes sp. NPDC051513]|uniref:CHAT domain-containing protein n=1 Tax=Actinoplanes sp. NPDC051513 TaxID=3363908 RepID=UPI00378B0C2B
MTGEQGDHWLERYDEDQDPAHLDRAVEQYEAAIATGPPGEAHRWWHSLGLAYQERAARRGDLADWNRAIHMHLLVADALIPGEARDTVLAMLCRAYLARDEPGDVDIAIETGRPAGDSEDPDIHQALGWAYQIRWDTDENPDDLDRAIEHWRRALAVVAEPSWLAECGRLLGVRGQTREDPDDAADAIALLHQAADGGEPCSWHLGMAHHLRWTLRREPADLERAAVCLDRGLAEAPEPEWLVTAHRDRLALTRDRLEAETAAAPGGIPPSAARLLQQVAEAGEVWASGVGDPDERARLAAAMAGSAALAWQAHPDRVNAAWFGEMLAAARGLTDVPPDWEASLDTLAALGRYAEEAHAGANVPSEALPMLLEPLLRGDAGPATLEPLRRVAPVFMAARAIQSGDRRMLSSSMEQLRASSDPEDHLLAEALALVDRGQQGDVTIRADLRGLLARLREEHVSYVTKQSIVPLLVMIESTMAGAASVYQPVDRTPIAPGDMLAANHALQGLFGPAMAAMTRHDVATLRAVGERIDELLGFFPAGHLFRLIALGLGSMTGVALLRDEPGDRDTGRRLLRWTEDGLGIAGGAHHPRWSAFALARAESLRHAVTCDRAESRRWGLAGLRGHAWQVLLQSGTDDAVLAAADAGAAAYRVAGWCRADGAMDDLVAALDAGRGLVLSAATASRTIAERLADAGHADLAERWRSSAGYGSNVVTGDPLQAVGGAAFEVPDDLRTRVLHALDLSAPEPIAAADIRVALAAAPADALVYLVPSGAEQPGAAVVVPAIGDMSALVLPGLITAPGSAFDRSAAVVRDAGPAVDSPAVDSPAVDSPAVDSPAVDSPAERPASTPDDLCRWAWSAAMGPLLRHTATWGLGRPVRLILVPTGPLSAVPWHAAFRAEGSRRRYAIEDAVISYAISGRSFAESARRPARDVKSVLIVGDPAGDLPFAGVEASAIGRVFYPDGTFLGVGAAEPGTPRQVLDWISDAAPGPSLLHLACHGHTDPAHPADACLRLAGGVLTARRLLEASRTAELQIERVFLAACATGVAGADHDEAFSLATAFLAAGAHTVFGSLWPVPDEETSLLMFLVHHFLNEHGLNEQRCAPADALRHAQLWMLDPDREPPAGMPPELARHCRNPRAAEPRSWAAFTHRGT